MTDKYFSSQFNFTRKMFLVTVSVRSLSLYDTMILRRIVDFIVNIHVNSNCKVTI